MQNVPKIVPERLKAAASTVNHPDADLLTAFAERSLSEPERDAVLDHLARCGDCRDIVALALPATEALETAAIPARRGWLTWPALRWGFVAAGVVTIASFGVLRFQQRSQTAATGSQQSGRLEEAANEPKKAIAPFAASAPTEKKEKLPSPPAPAFTDSLVVPTATDDEKKTVARAEEPPARVTPQQAGRGIGSAKGAVGGGPLLHGPSVANQWQLQNNAQNQAPMATPPAPFVKQQHADADISASRRIPAATQKIEVSGASPVIATEVASLDAARAQNQPAAAPSSGANYAEEVGKAKLPVPQPAPGQIGGYVVDPTGAVVSNARITITPSKTGGPATAVTNSQGAWLIAGLPTGNYKAQAEAQGFKTTVLDLNYDANQPSMYSFTLSPGSVSEVVEVSSAQNAQVQAETASIGSTIADREVSQLPLNGRNITQLISPAAGPLPRWTISSAGAVQRSYDQGNTWQDVDVNVSAANLYSLEAGAKTSRAKEKDADKRGLKRDGATPTFRAVSALGPEVWAGGSGGVLYHSQDAGSHWIRVLPSSAGSILSGDIVALEFSDPQHGKVTTSTPEVWTTSDTGQTWKKQ